MKIKLQYIVFLLGFVLTACISTQSTGQLKQEDADSNQEKTGVVSDMGSDRCPKTIQTEIGKVVFDAEVIPHSGEDMKCRLYTVKTRDFDKEHIVKTLFSDIEVSEHDTYKEEDYYYGNKEEFLSVSPTGIFFYKPLFSYVNHAFSLFEDDSNVDDYLKNIDFDFADREQAKDSVLNSIKELGGDITDEDFIQLYSLDYETMQKNESAEDVDGEKDETAYKPSWSAEDNCYYFCIRQILDEIPVAYKYADVDEKINDYNAPVQVLYSESGIEMLNVNRLFDFSDTGTEANLLNLDKIAESIAKKYNNILTDAEYSVSKLELHYICIRKDEDSYVLRPAWLVTVNESLEAEGEKYSYTMQLLIDAETAKEIVL